jgi:hypothetical protein
VLSQLKFVLTPTDCVLDWPKRVPMREEWADEERKRAEKKNWERGGSSSERHCI